MQYKPLPPLAFNSVSSTASLEATKLPRARKWQKCGSQARHLDGKLELSKCSANQQDGLPIDGGHKRSGMTCKHGKSHHVKPLSRNAHCSYAEPLRALPQMRASVSPPRKSYPPTREFVAGGGQVTCKALAVILPQIPSMVSMVLNGKHATIDVAHLPSLRRSDIACPGDLNRHKSNAGP